MFLNVAKVSMICTCFYFIFNNYLGFTFILLLELGSEIEILYTESGFDLFYEICVPQECFLSSHRMYWCLSVAASTACGS